jgi:amidase
MDPVPAKEAAPRAQPPSSRELASATALELAALFRSRAVSAEELTRLSLDAIDASNPLLSAFVDILHEPALRDARALDKAARKPRARLPPFAGVPIGINDLNLAKGSFTRFGSRAFEKLFTPFDDATTARLREAGFVVVGKTATSELGALPVTEPAIHPPTRNPWDLGVTAGGSSGGAAAALASGMVSVAQGSDAGGSIRIPSSFCHLVGLKPSRGRVENSYGLEDGSILYTAGPMAHSVDDVAAMLDVFAGVTVGKPHWAPLPTEPFLTLARRAPRRLRIRFVTKSRHVETNPEAAAAVVRVAHLLAELGHDVDEGEPLAGSIEEFLPVYQRLVAEAPVVHDWSKTEAFTRWLGEAGRNVRREDVARRLAAMSKMTLAWFGDVDAWLTPTVAVAPPPIGAWNGLEPSEVFDEAVKLGVFTVPFNVSGQPAVSVPAGRSAEGHPLGVQVVGRPLADGVVLALAKQVEDGMPWRRGDVRPPPLPALFFGGENPSAKA